MKVFIDGINKIEAVGATVRLKCVQLVSAKEGAVETEEVVELIIPIQNFPTTAKNIATSLQKFIKDNLYTSQGKE